MTSPAPYLWMLIGSLFFAAMSLFTESLGDEYSFAWIASIRSAVATLLALIMLWLRRGTFVFFRPATLWLRSLAGCSSMMFLFYAMTHYDVSIILSLSSMFPIWVAILSWPMLGQLPGRDTWIALAVSILGMLLVYTSAVGDESSFYRARYVPHLAIPAGILAAFFSGIALIGLHKVKNIDSMAVVAHFSLVSTVIGLIIWCIAPASDKLIETDTSSLVRLIAVGVTAMLGQFFLTRAFAEGRPARVSVVGLSQIAVAFLYKWAIEGMTPTLGSLLGMVLIIGATLRVMLLSSPPAKTIESPST